MENKNVPSIRFKGFIDDWEQRKLSEIVILYGGNAFKSSDSKKEGTRWLKIANIGFNRIDWSTSSYLPKEYWEKYEEYQLKKNDYVMALTRPILNGTLKISKIDQESLLNQRIAKLDFTTDYEFGFQLLKMSRTVSLIENELAGTDPPNLSSKNLDNINIEITSSNEEQTKIGTFFKQLDKTIALHERELELLNLTKKGFLQQIFPGNKQKYPNIRFENFDEEWEQCELIELAEFNPKSKLPKEFEYVDLESVVGTSLIDHRTETINSAPSRAQRLAEFGDLFYQTVRPYQKNNYLYELPYNNYVFSTGYAQMRPKYNSYFLLTLVQEEKFVSRVLERSTGTSYPSINSNDLSKLKVRVPKKEEQTKIGNFFKQLDETINIQERKLNKLKKTKKSFLQKMFI
ncbi:restriction endonuclease subunit S [Vagococcus fluvialis]|uniref:restriction endonuclease subunit S n=1 Tax=Vagococcus fluvialis TaxID=2738 RepID=UPI003B590B1B